jgi:Tfp pilus assembly protein PilX
MIPRPARNEDGVALILAIAFMVVVGLISASLFGLIRTSVNDRSTLDTTRNREYAADAAIERAIVQVRNLDTPGPAFTPCPSSTSTVNGITIQVTCANAPTAPLLHIQRNVIFTASWSGDAVIRAQVYFATNKSPSDYLQGDITRTYIQSWSVNR